MHCGQSNRYTKLTVTPYYCENRPSRYIGLGRFFFVVTLLLLLLLLLFIISTQDRNRDTERKETEVSEMYVIFTNVPYLISCKAWS